MPKASSVLSGFLATLCMVLSLLLPVLAYGHITGDQPIYRVSDGSTITFDQMMAELKGTQVVLVGETHDSPEHHQLQLAIIDAYRQNDTPIAVGAEMFTADSQRHLDRWTNGSMSKSSFIRIYYQNWQVPWPLYSDIFLYTRSHQIPLIGLNIDPAIPKKVARKGFASLTEKERKKIPAEVSCSVDPEYLAFIRRIYASHKKNERTFIHFCEAQRLWNSAMASGIVDYLKKNKDMTLVVLTGAGHALKSGIPAEMEHVSKMTYKVILPEFPEIGPGKVATDDADYIVLD